MNTSMLQAGGSARGSGKIRYFMGLLAASVAAMALMPLNKAEAHGWVTDTSVDVKSRAYMCYIGQNSNCGAATWNYNDLEYSPGLADVHFPSAAQACTGTFAECGPANGSIASAGRTAYSGVDEQTATRWIKNPIKPGVHTFKWHYTAGHRTAYKEFYITRNGWNPNAPLSRDAFELEPIARFELNNAIPTGNETYPVNIPADRLGYHVILATWRVGDTAATFYQAIDVDVQNDSGIPSNWKQVGTINAEPLKAGSKVVTRVFTNAGEQPQRSRTLTIASDADGHPNLWPTALAAIVPGSDGYVIGALDVDKDEVVPSPDGNHVYVGQRSDVTQVIVDKEHADRPSEIRISGLSDSYQITDGRVQLHYNAEVTSSSRKFNIATMVMYGSETVGFGTGEPGSNHAHFSIALEDVEPGEYDVLVTGRSDDNIGESVQATKRITLKQQPAGGDYDYVFPESLNEYKAGTKVLGKDGGIYQCKAWPYDGYCRQWTPTTNAYEPGVGYSWNSAWDKL